MHPVDAARGSAPRRELQLAAARGSVTVSDIEQRIKGVLPSLDSLSGKPAEWSGYDAERGHRACYTCGGGGDIGHGG